MHYITRDCYVQWMQEHLWEPSVSMLRELFMHDNKEIVDANAIVESRESLSRMINDYATSHHVKHSGGNQIITPEQASRMAEQLDMSLLTRTYETEIQVGTCGRLAVTLQGSSGLPIV
jgi:hypothetical protein